MKLSDHDGIVISISGGKDSQTILDLVFRMVKEQGYEGQVVAVHADTGAEDPASWPHCQYLCDAYGIALAKAVPCRPLPVMIEQRCRKLQAEGRKGGWPSAACRYCTSDTKRSPIQRVTREWFPNADKLQSVLMVTGERRQESRHRAKLPEFSPEKGLTTLKRTVTTWRPILDYRLEDVWRTIGNSGLRRHVAYDRGQERLSCAICVLAKESDIRLGAQAFPELAEHYLRIERETGHTFRADKSLADILKP